MLERLAQDPETPNTLSPHVLKELRRGFDGFKASEDQIRDELYGHLADRASSLDEEALGFLKSCIAQLRFDLEGRFFEIEKKEQEIIFKKQIDELKKSLFPNLEGLQNSYKQTTSDLAILEKQLKAVPDADRENLQMLRNKKKTEQEEMTKIHKELRNNQQIKSLGNKGKMIVAELGKLHGIYQSTIEKLRFENICNPKSFNFGCSEQLLIDHIFRAALILICNQLKVSAMQTQGAFHSPHHPHYSPGHFSPYITSPSRPKVREITTVSADHFQEVSKGVWLASPQSEKLSSKNFHEIELLLTNPGVRYVVLDTRKNYNHDGDKIIRDNIRLIQPWYQKNLNSLKEEEIYKLVWFPKEKVIDDLMNQASFWPEEWLLSMKIYWEKCEG